MIAAVVLAAGGSTRLGRPKPLVRVGGQTLLRRAVHAARGAGCDPVVVVLGSRAELLLDELGEMQVHSLVHDGWRNGLGSSVAAGVSALSRFPDVRGALLLLCDQVRLDAEVLGRLIRAWDGTPGARAACAYGGTLGTPALFGRGWFPRLAALGGEGGAQALLRLSGGSLSQIEWPDGLADLDTPNDLDRLPRESGGAGQLPDL